MQKAKLISDFNLPAFSRVINEYLAKGYHLSSVSLGPERFSALMIIDAPPGELYSLTASKEHLISILYAMCHGCQHEGCDFCIMANATPDPEEFIYKCMFTEEDEYPDGIILFDRAIAAGLIRHGDA